MDDVAQVDRPPLRTRAAAVLDRVEGVYLKLLRAIILAIATLLIGYAIVLAAISLYRIAQSPESVIEKEAAVTPQDLAAAPAAPSAAAKGEPAANPAHRRAYDQLLSRYHQLFRSKFEPFRQKDDKQLSRAEFDDNFVGTAARLKAATSGEINFDGDVADLRSLVEVMVQAATLPATQKKLTQYQAAKKVQICRSVERTRTTTQRGWDRLSTACPNWFYEPIGCSVTREVQTPYTARECTMKFPEGTQSHTQLFRAYQDRFYALLAERRRANASEAQAKRGGIIEGIAQGKLDLWRALLIAGGFLLLMFFFLLIAIERHQRRIAVVDAVGPS
jgi:hypothetical protein